MVDCGMSKQDLTNLSNDELLQAKHRDDERAARIVCSIFGTTTKGEADYRVSLWDEFDRRGMEWDT